MTDRRLGELERLKLAAIVESSDDAITSADLDGIVTSWNKGAEQMFGYTAEEMIGQSGSVLVPEGETTDSSARIAAVVEFGEGRFEVTRRRKDGTLIEIAVTMSAVRNRAGEVVGVASIAQDITDRRRLEQEREEFTRELEVRNERLLELDHLKDEFVALVSHELRTPLTSIRGYLELVLDGEAGRGHGRAAPVPGCGRAKREPAPRPCRRPALPRPDRGGQALPGVRRGRPRSRRSRVGRDRAAARRGEGDHA